LSTLSIRTDDHPESPCSYIFASEESEPQEAALRAKRPDGITWDNSSYNILHPGVMVGCGKTNENDDKLLSTSGIQVVDNGDEERNDYAAICAVY
jgi:hypothetical protein